jgi:AcrR family transcriptional regulator
VSVTADAGRATRLPKEQRRIQVLDAAREVFVESGYHAAGMDDIAERAGVSKPVLYQHFPGKLDLYLALLDAGIDDLLATMDIALRSTSDNKKRVQAAVGAYFDFVDDPQGAYRLVFESDLTNEPAVRDRVDQVELALAQEIAAVIAADTGLSAEEALLLGTGLQGMAHVSARRWLRNTHQKIDRAAAAELIAALAWRGIRGFPMTHPPTEERSSS